MEKKRKRTRKWTREDQERWDRNTRMLEERIAYHEAKAREEDERRARGSLGRRLLKRLQLAP